MKLKIKVKELTSGCMPEISMKGDWIDLKAAEDISIHAAQSGVLRKVATEKGTKNYRDVEIPVIYIPLGIAVKLPDGFEAIIASRSSGPKKLNIFIPSGQGVVDNVFCGNKDEWMYVASPMKYTKINKGDRICQFRIQLSQKATVWQKIRWLFSSGVEIVVVDDLGNESRGGLGSSGIR